MSETIELLPCPFCLGGGNPHLFQWFDGKNETDAVECSDCKTQTRLTAWQTRAPHQEIAGPRQEASEGKLLALIVDLEARLIPQDGRSSWFHVEDFRQQHGHLPDESAAPCKACFRERTEARVAIVRLKQAALALGEK